MVNFLPEELIMKILEQSHPYLFYQSINDLMKVDHKCPEMDMWVGDLYYEKVWGFIVEYLGKKKFDWRSKTGFGRSISGTKALGGWRLDRIKERFPGFNFWNTEEFLDVDLKELRGTDLVAMLYVEYGYGNFYSLNLECEGWENPAPKMRRECDYFINCMKGQDFELHIKYDARRKSRGVFNTWEAKRGNKVTKECFTYSYDKVHVIKV
jgi:hypothetical protein